MSVHVTEAIPTCTIPIAFSSASIRQTCLYTSERLLRVLLCAWRCSDFACSPESLAGSAIPGVSLTVLCVRRVAAIVTDSQAVHIAAGMRCLRVVGHWVGPGTIWHLRRMHVRVWIVGTERICRCPGVGRRHGTPSARVW